jgi:2-hydroxy-6-oxonona-2,4-dienedioate hydrolase
MDNLVFVHGFLGGSPQWQAQVDVFSEHYRVITPDLPGFGLNNECQAPETIAGFATYVLDELDRQQVERFHLVGHSMGGMIVQEMVRLAPDRVDKLVLYGTGPIGKLPGRFESLDESRRRIKQEGIEVSGPRIAETWFLEGALMDGFQLCAQLALKATMQAAQAGLTAMEGWSGESALTTIRSPTLVLWGDGDRAYHWSQPEQLWRQISDAQLAVIPGCAHAVHLEKPHLFNPVLMDFLQPAGRTGTDSGAGAG